MDTWSVALSTTTSVLFIISELLSLSKCDANGIIHFFINNLKCLKDAGIKEVAIAVKVYCEY